MKTCRICHKADFEDRTTMIRVGARHSVHVHCKLDKLNDKAARVEWLRSLRLHQWQRDNMMLDLAVDDADSITPGIYTFVMSALNTEAE